MSPSLINHKCILLFDYIDRVTREKMTVLNIEVSPHPPYTPDLAPSDYRHFQIIAAVFIQKAIYNC